MRFVPVGAGETIHHEQVEPGQRRQSFLVQMHDIPYNRRNFPPAGRDYG